MHLLDKISNSRQTLKSILSNEWNTDPIIDISTKELEIMYKNMEGDIYINSACNFTLINKNIPSHKLHVIYYNFPELNRSGTKVNKTCCDKIYSLYKQDDYENDYQIFNKEDSLIIIINEPISESLQKAVENMYLSGQEILQKTGLSNEIKDNIIYNNIEINQSYFRNINIFDINTLIRNLLVNNLVPKHEAIRDNKKIKEIYEMTNTNSSLLPVILKSDPIAKLIQLVPGDICKITRKSKKCGEYIYFRICKC